MRGDDNRTGKLFSYVDLEARVRRDHPLRAIRGIVNEALVALEQDFSALYPPIGRPSRRRSCFGQCFCRRSIRSARSGF
jgi:transposase